MTTRIPNQCRACARFGQASGSCEAYPRGIPKGMLYYGEDHTKPRRDDGGIRFQQGDSEAQQEAFQAWEATFK